MENYAEMPGSIVVLPYTLHSTKPERSVEEAHRKEKQSKLGQVT
jgi:hypothetical protein